MMHEPARENRPLPVALTIAGSDSGGGAGIQADLKTFADFSVHGTSALSALTAQNTRGVQGIHGVPPAFVQQQVRSILDDFTVGGIKTGMLASTAIINAVAEALSGVETTPLVVDPVMVAGSGDPLLEPAAITCLRDTLVPRAAVLTPNLPEAELLLDGHIKSLEDMQAAGRDLLELGCAAVVMKGGHLAGPEVIDLLLTRDFRIEARNPRLDVRAHGTGCTFAAAMAAALARGDSLESAFQQASAYVARVLRRGHRPGGGDTLVLGHGLTGD